MFQWQNLFSLNSMQYKHSDVLKWSNSTYFKSILLFIPKRVTSSKHFAIMKKKWKYVSCISRQSLICFSSLQMFQNRFWGVTYVVQQLKKILVIRLSILWYFYFKWMTRYRSHHRHLGRKQHGRTKAEILKCWQIISNLNHYRASEKGFTKLLM